MPDATEPYRRQRIVEINKATCRRQEQREAGGEMLFLD